MRILFTGASSFTGYWLASALSQAGHQVVAPLRSRIDTYSPQRADRVRRLSGMVELVEEAPFGSDAFLQLLAGAKFDLLCHHAAQVGDYRDPNYDVVAATAANTHRLQEVLQHAGGMAALVLTGTFFEQDEGAGSSPHRAFSPYGLSKGLTAQIFRYYCERRELPLAKFVIPHPFGPFEEPRFTAYVANCALAGKVIEVRTPAYVRDNIHVDLLAACYVRFVAAASQAGKPISLNPSGYVETQGAFTDRMAREFGKRLGRICEVRHLVQTDFPEPRVRINRDHAASMVPEWSEQAAWDGVLAYFKEASTRAS